jgi:ribonuclease P protein component
MLVAARLKGAGDLRLAVARGQRAEVGPVIVYARNTGEPRPARVGVSTTKGVGGAVVRNRARRRLREAVRRAGALRPGCDVVVVAGPGTTGMDFHDLVNRVVEGLRRAGALP